MIRFGVRAYLFFQISQKDLNEAGRENSCSFFLPRKDRAGEVRAQLYVALDRGYINAVEFDELSALAIQVSRMISGLMAYLKQSGIKGTKYKTTPAIDLKLET